MPRSCAEFSKYCWRITFTANYASPISGAPEKISSLRVRYQNLSSSIAHHESRISNLNVQLARMNRPKSEDEDEGNDLDDGDPTIAVPADEEIYIAPDDLRREEEEIRELEKKKRALEDRISGMERDLGGFLR